MEETVSVMSAASEVILDASALLALLNSEVGSDKVKAYLPSARMSVVNFSEVIAKLIRDKVPAADAAKIVYPLIAEPVPFDMAQAGVAAELVTETQKYGLSLGDRACLSLALVSKLPVLTADVVWAKLPLDIPVILIR